MTDDQQFIIALVTVVVPTVASILALRKGEQTHQLLNGMQKKRVRVARSQAVTDERKRAAAITDENKGSSVGQTRYRVD